MQVQKFTRYNWYKTSIFLDNITCFAIISLHNRDYEVLTFLMPYYTAFASVLQQS